MPISKGRVSQRKVRYARRVSGWKPPRDSRAICINLVSR